MSKFELFRPVVVPQLEKGGTVVAIDADTGTYLVDFGYGEVREFTEDRLEHMPDHPDHPDSPAPGNEAR